MEGVGSSRRDLTPLLDASVWIQSDEDRIHPRNALRIRSFNADPD